jgi:hypothetical protein
MPKPFPDNPPNRAYGTTPGTEENPIVVTIEPGFASGGIVPGPPENRTEKGRQVAPKGGSTGLGAPRGK